METLFSPLMRCRKCGVDKPPDAFPHNRRQCLKCRYKARTEWRRRERAANPAKFAQIDRSYHLRKNLGITLDQFDALLAAQGGGCAICGARPEDSTRNFHVDHDHACCPDRARSCGNCIRGILCSLCNTGLGGFRDDLELLRRATDYLVKP